MASSRRPLRVLLVTVGLHPNLGGPPKVVAGLAEALAEQGQTVAIATLYQRGRKADTVEAWPQLSSAGVALYLFPHNRPLALGSSRQFGRFLNAHIGEYDVLHLHSLWSQCLNRAARAARNHGIPYVLSPHGTLDRLARSMSRGKKVVSMVLGTRSLLEGAAVIQYGTREEADEAADLGLAAPVAIIPNGLKMEDHHRDRGVGIAPLLEEFPDLATGAPTFLSLTRIHPKKGLEGLLAGFSTLSPDSQARLLLAAIPEDKKLEKLLRRRLLDPDLRGRAFLTTGYVGSMKSLPVNASDVFVHAALQEGFSMAIIEALAYGFPVLITDQCHLPEVEEKGVGLVVPPTAEGLASGLREMAALSGPELVEMGRRGRAWAQEEFSWTHVARQIADTYQRIVDPAEPPR